MGSNRADAAIRLLTPRRPATDPDQRDMPGGAVVRLTRSEALAAGVVHGDLVRVGGVVAVVKVMEGVRR